MKTSYLVHGLVLFAGFVSMRMIGNRSGETGRPEAAVVRELKTMIVEDSSRDPGTVRRLEPARYREAWRALALEKLSPAERYSAQVELLKLWAEVDLEGAIRAILAEPWDEFTPYRGHTIELLLAEGLQQAISDRPQEVWGWIQNKKFGILGSSLVRDAWCAAIGKENPELFVTYIPELHGRALTNAIEAMTGNEGDAVQSARLWNSLGRSGVADQLDKESATALAGHFGLGMRSPELKKMLEASTGAMRELAARSLAIALVWPDSQADLTTELENAPADLQGAMAAEFLSRSFGREDVTRLALQTLIEREDWEWLDADVAGSSVRQLADTVPAPDLAEWVYSLPQRSETVEMFHRGVEPFIQQEREAAWEWMSSLEAGMWRDRAFAEYSQQALHRWGDAEASRVALDQIEDAEFRATAEGWRQDWARQNGK